VYGEAKYLAKDTRTIAVLRELVPFSPVQLGPALAF
jgi:hypothetical protein